MKREPPFHKQLDTSKQAGQVAPDKTLADYIARKTEKPKLTFDEWWTKQGFNDNITNALWKHEFKTCWQEAQSNV